MVRIYKTTDKIPVKIDSLTFEISPLTFEVKSNIQASLLDGNPLSIVRAAKDAIKHSVKSVKGVEDANGNPYELEFEDGALTEDCVNDLLNIDQDDKLSLVCTSLLNGIPKNFVDPSTGKKIEGISIETKAASRKKK